MNVETVTQRERLDVTIEKYRGKTAHASMVVLL